MLTPEAVHSPAPEIHQFFSGHETALPLYLAVEACLLSAFPDTRTVVRKTQISFSARRMYACVSLARVRRKAELPDPYLTLTLAMPYPVSSGRVAARTEAYPGRWTTHFVLAAPDDLDAEMKDWIREAYAFADRPETHRIGTH